jgi:hypothetical protein
VNGAVVAGKPCGPEFPERRGLEDGLMARTAALCVGCGTEHAGEGAKVECLEEELRLARKRLAAARDELEALRTRAAHLSRMYERDLDLRIHQRGEEMRRLGERARSRARRGK